jgi:hypothetical protein
MPVHDWTRVTAGTFHAFHVAWIAEIQRVLNGGLLPAGYYALAEQVAGEFIPDVLALQANQNSAESEALKEEYGSDPGPAVLTVTEFPPRVRLTTATPEIMSLALRTRRIAIRHATGDRIVALLEIVPPGNKASQPMLRAFIDKAAAALHAGYHLLILDLWPPGRWDPAGIHGALWALVGGTGDVTPPEQPLTLAAYAVQAPGRVTAYVEPTEVGAALLDMPLFLAPDRYIQVPLESAYQAAWQGFPERWRRVIESPT